MFAALLCAISFALSTVLTRRLKELHYSLIQFHYAGLSTCIILAWLIIEFTIKHSDKDVYPYDTLRMLSYKGHHYLMMVFIGICNAFNLNIMTIAAQNAPSAYVQLITQTGTAFAFMSDTFIFRIMPEVWPTIGACVIILFNVAAIYNKLST